ncbi:MAG: MinD/ParA family ATP-binding protein [Myxococcota bacterium]
MPRELADVLHYFLPETGAERDAPPGASASTRLSAGKRPIAALPLVALPIGDRDVVRAAFAWNLCVEVTRLGGRGVLVSPSGRTDSVLWPSAGPGPLGSETVLAEASGLGELYRVASDVAVERAAGADPDAGGVVLVRVPPSWLRDSSDGTRLLRWCLLFSTSEPDELLETYGLTKLLRAAQAGARVGVTLHGVRRIRDAERAFGRLARTAEEHLGCPLTSYGALMDDLHVFRAIVARRPIGLEHPQSPAARALHDVAGMLLDDALAWIDE